MAYSKQISDILKRFFNQVEWQYDVEEYENRCLYKVGMNLDDDSKISKIILVFNIQENDISIISFCAIKSDSKNMDRMAEYICRANYGLKAGNFEFDCDDGKIRYKIYIDVHGREITEKEIARAILVSGEMWSLYGEGILEVLGSNKESKKIVEEIEKVKIE